MFAKWVVWYNDESSFSNLDGEPWDALAEDYELAAQHRVTGSPTYLLNDDRQRLYGNVGYRIIEANVLELLRDNKDRASWC